MTQQALLVASPQFLSGLIQDPALKRRCSSEGLVSSCSENFSQCRFARFINSLHQGNLPQRPINGKRSTSRSESLGQI